MIAAELLRPDGRARQTCGCGQGPTHIDLTGKKVGRWSVLRRAENSAVGGTQWHCRCECGTEKVINGIVLRDARSRSCGCLKVDALVERSTKHGLTPMGGKQPPEYVTWVSMIQRCTNFKRHEWLDYGGRGIMVCKRWREDFRNFLSDMGKRPKKRGVRYSLDRINVDGHYTPQNCRWATDEEQAQNRRRPVKPLEE